MSHHQNSWQNHNIKITYKSIENVAKFECLGMTVKGKAIPVTGCEGP
jgi:hypothetical protein